MNARDIFFWVEWTIFYGTVFKKANKPYWTRCTVYTFHGTSLNIIKSSRKLAKNYIQTPVILASSSSSKKFNDVLITIYFTQDYLPVWVFIQQQTKNKNRGQKFIEILSPTTLRHSQKYIKNAFTIFLPTLFLRLPSIYPAVTFSTQLLNNIKHNTRTRTYFSYMSLCPCLSIWMAYQ